MLIVSNDEFAELSTRGAEAYEARLRTIGGLAPRLTGAERAGNLYRATPRELRGYFRGRFGAGWALTGDAGYYAHPAAAHGIADALRSAELVHGLVERAWREERPAETYLEEYQHTRDAENTEAFYHSYRLGQVNPFDEPELAAEITGHASPAAEAE